jgi:hypothetical protein
MKYRAIISTQVKDEDEYLDEWIAYHLAIGFEHVVIYDNESARPLRNRWGKFVTVKPERRQFEGSAADNCHNDTVRNFAADWIARIDVDEFIVLKQPGDINSLLAPYKDFGGLGLNWRIFGTSGHTAKPAGLVRNNYVWRMPDNCGWVLNGGSFQLKTIIRREFCLQVHHPHFCKSSRQLVNEDFVPYPDAWTDSTRSRAVIHHYVTKSVEEWNKKYDLWRHRFGLRTPKDLADIEANCIVYDNSFKTTAMDNHKNWEWASHQPIIKAVLDLYKPEFVLELGIGENSTPLFAGLNYIGIENERDWINYLTDQLRTQQTFIWHNLDRQACSLTDYYNSLQLPADKPNLLFVDNYESCRMIAINTLRQKFDLILFHDCEPTLGAKVNHYDMIDSTGFAVYFLKTPANWTGFMVRQDFDAGFAALQKCAAPHIDEFIGKHPAALGMRLSNKYEE